MTDAAIRRTLLSAKNRAEQASESPHRPFYASITACVDRGGLFAFCCRLSVGAEALPFTSPFQKLMGG
jgi:hypothetical protein